MAPRVTDIISVLLQKKKATLKKKKDKFVGETKHVSRQKKVSKQTKQMTRGEINRDGRLGVGETERWKRIIIWPVGGKLQSLTTS